MINPEQLYRNLNLFYFLYNNRFFDSELPCVIITLERKAKVKGFFIKNSYFDKDNNKLSEICINPEYLDQSNIESVLSTLVHEMCHLYTCVKNCNYENGYHGRVWAEKMKSIGLIPTDSGKIGGKETGYNITQVILREGEFHRFTEDKLKLFKDCFYARIIDTENLVHNSVKCGKRYKYSCGCSNVWGKKDLSLMCVKCGNVFKKME